MTDKTNLATASRLGMPLAFCAALLAVPVSVSSAADGNNKASSSPSSVQNSVLIDPALLLSLVQQDWNGDGRLDKALLLRGAADSRQVALRIYLSDDSESGFHLAGRHDAIGWVGQGNAGRPNLSASKSGVTLRSGDSGSDKTPWHEVFSIDRRDDRFVVSRYTVNWHDKSDRRAGFRCDINLQTGNGVRNMTSLESVPSTATLEDWQRDALPEGCQVKPGES